MVYDPNWTAAEAEAAAAESGADFSDPTNPLSQWAAHHHLNDLKEMFDAGIDNSLFAAIRVCACHDLVMPTWVSRAFIQRYDKVNAAIENSWDIVFGRPYRKGTHIATIRKHRQLQLAVWIKANEILAEEPNTPIDEWFFERIGQEVKPPAGKTLTQELYYRMKKIYRG